MIRATYMNINPKISEDKGMHLIGASLFTVTNIEVVEYPSAVTSILW